MTCSCINFYTHYNHLVSKKLTSVFTALIVLTLFALTTPRFVTAAVQWDQKGITLRLVNQEIGQVNKSLEDIKATGANYVTITPGWHTDTLTTSNVDRKERTPADELLIYTINRAHSIGLKVFIKPHIDPKTGEWRAKMNPTDKATFFKNYKSMILHYAKLSQSYKVEQFSLGSELFALSTNKTNEPYWRDIITETRKVYSGTLTFNANASATNFDETTLPFWDALDVIGLSMYYPLSEDDKYTAESLQNNWKVIDKNFVEPLYNKYKKPIVFTEIGYRSMDGAAEEPGDYKVKAEVDLQEQVDLYNALFTYWEKKSYMNGVHMWDWNLGDNPGGEKDDDYTPQNKPALQVLIRNFIQGLVEGSNDVSPEVIVQEVENIIEQVPPVINIENGVEIDAEQPSVNISGIEIKSPSNYYLTYAKVGQKIFYDRDYIIKELPKVILNEAEIVTANNHKLAFLDNHLSFAITEESSVYVGYDYRATRLPEWLRDWERLNEQIMTNDTNFVLYKKDFTKGLVELGGNFNGSAGAKSNYIVFITGVNSPQVEGAIDTNITNEETITIPEDSIDMSDNNNVEVTEATNTKPLEISEIKLVVEEPQSGAIISGEKKLKAYIPGLARSNYTAYIMVDGRKIDLEDSKSDDIKQAKIEFDQWSWNGSGPYNVEVVAQDLEGKTIDTEKLIVFVKH